MTNTNTYEDAATLHRISNQYQTNVGHALVDVLASIDGVFRSQAEDVASKLDYTAENMTAEQIEADCQAHADQVEADRLLLSEAFPTAALSRGTLDTGRVTILGGCYFEANVYPMDDGTFRTGFTARNRRGVRWNSDKANQIANQLRTLANGPERQQHWHPYR